MTQCIVEVMSAHETQKNMFSVTDDIWGNILDVDKSGENENYEKAFCWYADDDKKWASDKTCFETG